MQRAHSIHAVKTPLRDPFDRLLIAQSQIEDVALVSDDGAFDAFDVRRFW